MTIVFAQKDLKSKDWSSIPVFNAVKGFKERGFEIIPFYYRENEDFGNTKEDIVVGGIPCVKKALEKFNITLPDLSYPKDNIKKYYDRKLEIKTIKEINQIVNADNFDKFFIKPYNSHKLFTGHVVSEFKDLFKSMNADYEQEVVFSEYVDFLSEYRIFVIDGNIESMSFYNGNPLVFPNKEVIKNIVKDCYDEYQLNGFSVDIGITSDNRTLIVELNDGFSLGCYGLNYMTYSLLIEKRWKQLMEQAT